MSGHGHDTRVRTTLFAFGSNGQGQLGVGDNEDHHTPQSCLFLQPSSVNAAAKEDTSDHVSHVPLSDGERIHKLASGGNHTLLLTTHGRVFTTGLSDAAQDHERQVRPEPHSNATSMTTRHLGVNSNCWSQSCGTDKDHDFDEARITDIACTWTASFFVVDGHKVNTIGHGNRGELGLGQGVSQSSQPQTCFDVQALDIEDPAMPQTDRSTRIVGISASMAHVVVLLSSGRLFGWGTSRKGQLGEQGKDQVSVWKPTEIILSDSRFVPSFVVTGREWTFLSSATGSRYRFFGDDKKLDLVTQWAHDEWEEAPEPIHALHAGWSSVTVLTQHGQIRGYGKDDRGQLPPSALLQEGAKVQHLAVGSEHTVAALEDGRVVAWGWGEHGNCGSTVDENKNVKTRYNTISENRDVPPRKIAGVAAGCATSFFWFDS